MVTNETKLQEPINYMIMHTIYQQNSELTESTNQKLCYIHEACDVNESFAAIG